MDRVEIRYSLAKVAVFALLLAAFAVAVSVLLARPITSRAMFETVRAAAGYRALIRSLDFPQYRDLIVGVLLAVDGSCLWLVAALARQTIMGPALALDRDGRGRYVGFRGDVEFRVPSGAVIELTPAGLTFLPPASVVSPARRAGRPMERARMPFRFVAGPPRAVKDALLRLGYTVDSPF